VGEVRREELLKSQVSTSLQNICKCHLWARNWTTWIYMQQCSIVTWSRHMIYMPKKLHDDPWTSNWVKALKIHRKKVPECVPARSMTKKKHWILICYVNFPNWSKHLFIIISLPPLCDLLKIPHIFKRKIWHPCMFSLVELCFIIIHISGSSKHLVLLVNFIYTYSHFHWFCSIFNAG
jgi:hypothetical protein